MLNIMKMVAFVLIPPLIQGCADLQPHAIKSGSEHKAIELLRTDKVKEECNIAVPPGWRIGGCARTISTLSCKIVVFPDVTDEILGHELRHCFDGNWHSDDNLTEPL